MTHGTPPLAVVVGPTGIGKTRLAVALARALGEVELINGDSRQTQRHLRIGTCTPTPADLEGVDCHLLDLRDPGQEFGVGAWLRLAREAVAAIESRGRRVIVVGGSALYVRALLDGFDPELRAPDRRRRIEREGLASTPSGLATLVAQLLARDPSAGDNIDLANPRRVIRALEIIDRRPGSSLRDRTRQGGRSAVWIGLDTDPGRYRSWVATRTRSMLDGGLLAEVEAALQRGTTPDELARAGIGYAEAMDLLAGRVSATVASERITQRTLRYAKSQRTWWRRDSRIQWIDPGLGWDAAHASALAALHRYWGTASH